VFCKRYGVLNFYPKDGFFITSSSFELLRNFCKEKKLGRENLQEWEVKHFLRIDNIFKFDNLQFRGVYGNSGNVMN